jgi:hypothetical protein
LENSTKCQSCVSKNCIKCGDYVPIFKFDKYRIKDIRTGGSLPWYHELNPDKCGNKCGYRYPSLCSAIKKNKIRINELKATNFGEIPDNDNKIDFTFSDSATEEKENTFKPQHAFWLSQGNWTFNPYNDLKEESHETVDITAVGVDIKSLNIFHVYSADNFIKLMSMIPIEQDPNSSGRIFYYKFNNLIDHGYDAIMFHFKSLKEIGMRYRDERFNFGCYNHSDIISSMDVESLIILNPKDLKAYIYRINMNSLPW